MRVEVVLAWPERFTSIWLDLPDGARVGQAVAAAGIQGEEQATGVAVFGVLASQDTVLHDGDRVELLRPLLMDPKDARRHRAGR